jgi:hypothetical protein
MPFGALALIHNAATDNQDASYASAVKRVCLKTDDGMSSDPLAYVEADQ